MTSIAIVPPRRSTRSSLAASLLLSSIAVSLGLSMRRPEYTIPSLITGAGIVALFASRLAEERRSGRVGRILTLLPDLLREGLDATPGRLTLQAGYTGRSPFKRLYIVRDVFTPQGEVTTITLDDILSRDNQLLIVAKGAEGVIAGDVYKIQIEDVSAYIFAPPLHVKTRIQRRRLRVRRGEEYAEAILSGIDGGLAITASHVGRRTSAILRLGVRLYNTILEARLAQVHSGAIHYTLFFAPRTPRAVIAARPVSIAGVARVLGYGRRELVALGSGIEARLRLELRQGPRLLESDEAEVATYLEALGETPST